MYSSALISNDAHALGPRRDLHDFVAGLDLAFFYDAEIETGPAVRDQQRGHPRLVHAYAYAVASDARLCDFKQSFANPVAIANAHLLVRQAVDGEILSELPVREIVSTKLAVANNGRSRFDRRRRPGVRRHVRRGRLARRHRY